MKKMDESIHSLLDKIDTKDPHQEIIEVQAKFTQIVEEAMIAYKKGLITVKIKALPQAMYIWAVRELPLMIQEPSNLPNIRKQLMLFHNAIDHILHPKEIVS